MKRALVPVPIGWIERQVRGTGEVPEDVQLVAVAQGRWDDQRIVCFIAISDSFEDVPDENMASPVWPELKA